MCGIDLMHKSMGGNCALMQVPVIFPFSALFLNVLYPFHLFRIIILIPGCHTEGKGNEERKNYKNGSRSNQPSHKASLLCIMAEARPAAYGFPAAAKVSSAIVHSSVSSSYCAAQAIPANTK